MIKMSLLGTLLLCSAVAGLGRDSGSIFPGAVWTKATPSELGWSDQKLAEARRHFDTLPPANLVVVDRGRIVVEWGDPAMKIMVSSVRKSILSVLYGIDLPDSKLDLDTTIGQLGIDDDPPLTAEEKNATVRMLLEARSGVYHSSVGNTPSMRLNKPERGTHAPGTFFYDNNWDFNALGTIFEQQFHTAIGQEFRDKIALPTQMEDFRLEDMHYKHAAPDDPASKSLHPAYSFRLSARDLARFGYLVLRDGNWNGKRIVPAGWIEQSTRIYTENARKGTGYGYLWWINGFGLSEKNFYASGALGKFLIVIPERDLVVVLLNHTEFPPNGSTMSVAEYNKLPTLTVSQMGRLLELLLDAQRAGNSPASGASTPTASVGAGVQMLTATEGVDFNAYLLKVYLQVKKSWFVKMPASVQLGDQGQNTVQFRILKDGTIPADAVKLVLTSGKKPLDDASLRAVREAGPFANLPEQYSGPFIELRFTFYYNVTPSNPQ